MNSNIVLNLVKANEPPFDCECCGTCYPEGLIIKYNGIVIWEKFSDGHYSGHQTQESILNTIVDKWTSDALEKVTLESSEDSRHKWNEQHPGNAIALTPDSWAQYHSHAKSYYLDSAQIIKENCQKLPYDDILQVKMIALWLEEQSSTIVEVFVS